MNHVHCQRIARAVEAAREGRRVVIGVDGSDDSAFLVWQEGRVRHVIAAGSERGMERMLPEAREEFARQMAIQGPRILERSAV